MLHPALDGEVGDGYPSAPPAHRLPSPPGELGWTLKTPSTPAIAARIVARKGLSKVPTTSSSLPRRQRDGPRGERIPDQRSYCQPRCS